ncbi:unnamed protein product [Merluccius merluccius]
MAERTPWWKAFMVKRKNGPKDTSHAFDPDFDPFASKPERAAKDPAAAAVAAAVAAAGAGAKASTQAQPGKRESTKGDDPIKDDTYDDSHLESVFNEQTCRRNMRVSRSGRFKEKRRVRSGLPIEEQEQDKNAPRREDQR